MPLHETMQVAVQFHNFLAGTQPQVKGIAQQDLRAALFYFFRRHPFYRAVGAHRHKRRGFHHAAFKISLPRRARPSVVCSSYFT